MVNLLNKQKDGYAVKYVHNFLCHNNVLYAGRKFFPKFSEWLKCLLLFNLKLVDLCERGNYGGLSGVLARVSLRGGREVGGVLS